MTDKTISTYEIEKKRAKPLGYESDYVYEEYYHGQFRLYRDEKNRVFLGEVFDMQSGEVIAQDELNEKRRPQGLSKRFWSGGRLKSVCNLDESKKPIGLQVEFDEQGKVVTSRYYNKDGSYQENYAQNFADISAEKLPEILTQNKTQNKMQNKTLGQNAPKPRS